MPALRPVGHEERLSLVEHLDELRTRLILCIAVFAVAFGVCYWQNGEVLHIINQPLVHSHHVDCNNRKKADDALERSGCFDERLGTYLRAAGPALAQTGRALGALSAARGVPPAVRQQAARSVRSLQAAAAQAARAAALTPKASTGRQPVTLGVTEPFLTTVTVTAYAALLLALPFLLFQAYAFVLPAFTGEERRVALPLMMLVPGLFAAGVAFGYFVALPRAVTFLQNYNDGQFDILVQARDYYRFCVLLLAGMGLVFQIPVGVLAIVRLQLLSVAQLRSARGYAWIVLAVVAAVVTPTPDPFTMLVVMAPLVVLWELSIQLARLFEPEGPSRWSFADDDQNDLD